MVAGLREVFVEECFGGGFVEVGGGEGILRENLVHGTWRGAGAWLERWYNEPVHRRHKISISLIE